MPPAGQSLNLNLACLLKHVHVLKRTWDIRPRGEQAVIAQDQKIEFTQVRDQPFPLIHPEDDAFVSMISDPIDEQRGRPADRQKPLGLGSNRETRTGMRVQNTLNIRSGLMDSPMNDEARLVRSEEHTSELQSLMRIS